MIEILLQRLHPEARLPRRTAENSIALDIYAHLLTEHGAASKSMIPPRTVKSIPTGWAIRAAVSLAEGSLALAQFASCSDLALKRTLTVACPFNAPNQEALEVLLYNGGYDAQWVQHGERIAHLIVVSGHQSYVGAV